MSDEFVDATFYAQVEPDWFGAQRLRGAKVVTITQKKPERPRGGTVLVKLTIRIPKAAFMPLRPEAIVVIPESMTETHPFEVLAQEPS